MFNWRLENYDRNLIWVNNSSVQASDQVEIASYINYRTVSF